MKLGDKVQLTNVRIGFRTLTLEEGKQAKAQGRDVVRDFLFDAKTLEPIPQPTYTEVVYGDVIGEVVREFISVGEHLVHYPFFGRHPNIGDTEVIRIPAYK